MKTKGKNKQEGKHYSEMNRNKKKNKIELLCGETIEIQVGYQEERKGTNINGKEKKKK